MKYLIVGLGNPGNKYENTRHNIGFKMLDALAERSNIFFSEERHGDIATLKHKGRIIILLKPNTFMNLSGKAVNYWLQKEKIPLERLLVLTDDLALPFGTLRIRGKGTDGGHNGLKHIIEVLGTSKYPRFRFGIGDEFSKGSQINYVLSPWSAKEEKQLPERLEKSADAILSFCSIGLPRTMSSFNNK